MSKHLLHTRKTFCLIHFMFICFFIFGGNLLIAAGPVPHDRESVSNPWDHSDHAFSSADVDRALFQKNCSADRHSLLVNVWKDISYLAHEPDFYIVVGGLAATPGVFKSAFRREEPEFAEIWGSSKFADEFFESGAGVGNSAYHFGAALLTYFAGKWGNESSLKQFGSDLFRAQTVTGLATISMKGLANRRRPNGGHFSFPSGHTSTAFTTATVIYHDFGPIWGSAAYVGATYVGLSRMQANKHYLSDVIGGAFLGTYLTFKILRREDDNERLEVSPLVGKDYHGINLQMRF